MGMASAFLLSSALTACAPASLDDSSATPAESAPAKAVQRADLAENETLVSTQEDYADAAASLNPGDTIVLANGRWENFEILFSGPVSYTHLTLPTILLV